MAANKNQWITPRKNEWGIHDEKSKKDTKTFKTQKEAIKYGLEIAKKTKVQLIVQSPEGKIQERHNFMGR